ncbi:DUF2304 domain-containing protein [Microbacterium sp. Au-Mic1]|uniref:DUF2304 domain-containing protein n=1 Tax=unclassified Microbacterium TaxID=2609290 RepID=UPI001E5E7CE9|nr:DUF2304 domain-containing protein [Microbacterium sp. Au-Mic1]MCE4025700.1 DUF2304 domain-containing protein [Microbacterium sp. Au-Mic1]
MIAVTGIVLGLAMLVIVTTLLLTRRLREKYAALWIIIGLGMLVLGVFPGLLLGLTSAFGVVLPANLLFAMAILLLLGVALHLSWELSQAEDEIRRAAEELAILRADHDGLVRRIEVLESGESDRPGASLTDD